MEEGKENSDDVTFIKMETTPPRKGDNITIKIFNSAAKSKTKKLVEKAMSLQRLRKNVKNNMDSLKELNDTCDFKEAPKLRKGKSRLKLKSCSSQEKSVSDDTPNSGAGDAQGHVKQGKNVSAAGASTQGETSRKTCEGSVCGSGEPAGSSVSGSQPSVPCVVCGTHLPESAHKDHQLTCLRHKFAKSSGSSGAPAGSVDKAGPVRCHVCGKDISHLSSHRQTQHINSCLDKEDEEKQAESHHRQQLETARQAVLDCPMCGKKFKVKSSRQNHLKKCALTNQMTVDQLKSLMRQQEEEHHAKLDAGVLPVGFGAKKGSKLSKQSRLPSVLDEDTQLALALSTSLAEVESRQEVELLGVRGNPTPTALTTELDTAVIEGKGQGRGKKGKQTEAGSLLTSLSTEEARERISDRVERYIFSTASEVQDAPQLTPPFKTDGVGLSSGLSEPAASSAALSSQPPPSSLLLSSSSSSKDPQKSSLWSKTALGVIASQGSSQKTSVCSDNTAIQSEFYVRRLMPPVSVSRVVTGSKLKRVSAIAGRKTSLGQLGNMDVEDEDGSPVASQTVDILAELAMESETADGEREAGIESDLPGGDRCTQTVPLTSPLQLDLTNNQSGKACGEDEVSDMEASGFCKEQPVMVNEAVSPGLSISYLGLVSSFNLSDLSILADHGTEIPAHKQVLYARCPQLLDATSVKSGREVIDLSGHTADGILCMLRYIYAGQVSILPSCVTDLRQLATRFSLHKLVDAVDKIVVPVDRQGDGDAAVGDDAGDDGDNSGLESTGEEEVGVDEEDEREASFDDNDWMEVFLTQRENMRKKEVQATAEGHEENDGGEGAPGDGQKDEGRCEEAMNKASEAMKDLCYSGPLNQPVGAAGIRDSGVTHSAHVLQEEVRPRDVEYQLDMDTDWHQSGADSEQVGDTSHADHQMDTVLTSVSHTHQQTHVTDTHSLQPLAEVTANCVTKPAGCTHPMVSSQEHKEQHHHTVSVGDVNLDGNETEDTKTVILFAKEEVKEEDSKTVILFANEMVKKEEPEVDGREGELPCRWVGEGQVGVVGGDGAGTTAVSNLNTGTDQPIVTTPTTNGQIIDLKVTAQKDKPLTSSKKRRKRKKVSAKEFKQLVDKVVSGVPEVRSTMGDEPVSSLLTDEDFDRIIVKMEQDFQAISSASSDEPNDSFYIPSVLDRVDDDDDDVVITNSDIKIPAFKRKPRQRRKPKSALQEGSSGAVVIGTKCSMAELMKDQHGASGLQHISPALVGVSVTDKMLPGTSSSLLTDQEKPDASHPLVTLSHIATSRMGPPCMAPLQKVRHIALHQSPIAAGTPSSSSKPATSSTSLPTPPLSSSKSTHVSTSPVFSSAAAKLYSSDTSQAVTNSSTTLPQRKTSSRKSDSSTRVTPPAPGPILQSSMTEIHPSHSSVERCLGVSYPPNEECISGDELFSDEEESYSLSKPSTSVAVPTSLRRPSDASWSLSTMVISSSPLAPRLDVSNTGVDRTKELETSVRRNIFPCPDPFTKPAPVSHQAESPHRTDKEDKSVSSAPTFTKIKHPPGSPGSKLQSCKPNSANVTKPVGDVRSQGHRSQGSSSRPANQTPLEVRGNLVDIVSDLMLDYVLTSGHRKKRGEDRSLHQTDDSFVQDSYVGGSPDPAQAVGMGKANEQNNLETSGTETDIEKGKAGRGQGSPLDKSPGLEKVASHLKMKRSSLGKSLNKALIAARSPPLADKSVASTDKNVTSADKNVTSADKNVTSADKSVTSADKNVTSADKNVTSSDKNVTSADKSVTSADKNVTSADKNVTSSDKNVTSADKNVTSADKNVTSADKNVTSADRNVTPTDKNVTSADKNVTSADKNVTSADKDVTSADRNVTPTDKNVTSGSKSNKSSSRSSTPTASKIGNVTVSSDSLSKGSPQSLSTHSVSPSSGSPRGQSSNSKRKRQPKDMSKPVCDDGNSDEGAYRSPMKTKRGLAKKRSQDSCGRQSPTASHDCDVVDLTCSQTPPHSPTHDADSSSSNVAGSEPSPSWQVKMCDRQETCQTSSPTQPAHGTYEVRTPSGHSHHSYTKCSDSFTAIAESPQVPSTSRDRSAVSLSDREQAGGQPSIHKSVACADESQSSDEENLCGAGNYLGSNSCSPVTSMPEGNSQGEGGVAESQRTVGKTGHHAEKLGVENSQLMTDSPLPLRQRLARMFEEEVLAIVGQSRGDKKSDTDNSCLSADERKQQTAGVSPAVSQPAGDVIAADFADDSDDAELCNMDVNNVGQQQQQHQKKQSSQNSSKETIGKTPNQKVGTKAGRKKKTWKEPSPFTPMAPYDEMNTPQLKNAVAKIGARPVGKKRMRELLKHVYHQTHQYETDSDYDGTPVKRGRTETSPSKLSFAAKLSHQPIGVTGTSKPANKQMVEGGKKAKTGKQKKTSSQTVPTSQSGRGGVSTARSLVSTVSTSSGGETEGREQEESSGSHDTSFSDGDGGDCPEESILQGWPEEEEEGIAPTQLTQSSAASITEKLVKFITDNKDIHEDILMYEPLELDIVKQRVADAGIRIGLAKVMDFLDERCITFTMKNMSSRNNNRRQLKGKPKASQRSPKKKKKTVQ